MAKFTRTAIIISFQRLLNEKELDKITVKDIVDECEINRKTFYYYFEDIYDLLRQTFEENLLQFDSSVMDSENPEKSMLALSEFIRKNKSAVKHVFNSVSREELEGYIMSLSKKGFTEYVAECARLLPHSGSDIDFISNIYATLFTSITMAWVRGGMRENPEKYIGKLCKMLNGSVEFMINNLNSP